MHSLVYDPIFLEHDTGLHPETSERLDSILEAFKKQGRLDLWTLLKPRKATLEEISANHAADYIETVEKVAAGGGGYLDGDTVVSPRSYEAALFAAGGLLTAIERVQAGKDKVSFALVRPPGHHARPSRGMGFCLFNNIVIGARFLQNRFGLDRVLIVDFDVHHGNGTQESLYEDGKSYFISSHQYPFYPGTGSETERGKGEGEGLTRNIPLSYGTDGSTLLTKLEHSLEEATASFSPQFLLVSAGFDAYYRDPIGGLKLRTEDFGELGTVLKDCADRFCDGKIAATLEGGYSLDGLPLCLGAFLAGLGYPAPA